MFCGAGHGGLPYDGDIIAIAGQDVAIDTIVCCGDLAVGEPGPGLVVDAAWEGLGLLSQGLSGLSVPVESSRVMRPESFWV